ncbi:MAG TPA: hypothetical protein VF158_11680, partial [Longimicrobiales bacterium]
MPHRTAASSRRRPAAVKSGYILTQVLGSLELGLYEDWGHGQDLGLHAGVVIGYDLPGRASG